MRKILEEEGKLRSSGDKIARVHRHGRIVLEQMVFTVDSHCPFHRFTLIVLDLDDAEVLAGVKDLSHTRTRRISAWSSLDG